MEEKINVETGTTQGCILSYLVFSSVIDWRMKNVTEKPRVYNELCQIVSQIFVDDICLLTQRESDMHEELKLFIHYGAQVVIKVNGSKT